MFGPRIEGRTGVSLIPPTLEHFNLHARWMMEPEVGRFWGPRFGDVTPERQEERFKKAGTDQTQIQWTIVYEKQPVGFTGIFDINWVNRDARVASSSGGTISMAAASRVRRYGYGRVSRGTNFASTASTTGSRTRTVEADARTRSQATGRWDSSSAPIFARVSGTTSGSVKPSRRPSPTRFELLGLMCPKGAAATRVSTRVE